MASIPVAKKKKRGNKRRGISQGPGPPVPCPSRPHPHGHDHDDELRSMVGWHQIPTPIFDRVEARFLGLKSDIVERGREVKALENQLREAYAGMADDTQRLRRRDQIIDEKARSLAHVRVEGEDRARLIMHLQREKQALEKDVFQAYQLVDVGTFAVREKRLEIEDLKKRLAGQEYALQQKDDSSESVKDVVNQMHGAFDGSVVDLALEAQAQRSLGMINGLQTDVADRDTYISNLRSTLSGQNAQLKALQHTLAEQEANISALQCEREEQTVKNSELEEKIKEAKQRVEDALKVGDEQRTLIDKVMAENARLQG